jgi:hypothetical protein
VNKEWLALCFTKPVLQRALVTSFIVGTILIVINHSDALIAGKVDDIRLFRMALTYLVPYLVATTSSVSTIMQMKMNWQEQNSGDLHASKTIAIVPPLK